MRGLRGGRDVDRVDVGDVEQLVVVRGGRPRARRPDHLLQPLRPDLRDVQAPDQRMRGARLRADAAAPTRADDADANLLHGSLLLRVGAPRIIQAAVC